MELKHHPDKVGRGDFIKLPPASIRIDPKHNIRDMTSERTRAHIEELKISIRAFGGVKEPIEVRVVGNDAFVTDGECRVTAVMEMIRDEGFECEGISCIKEAGGTDPEERLLNFGVSGTKERYTELELAEWCRRCERANIPHEKIAAAAGWKSIAPVKRHLDLISKLPDAVKEQVRADDVSATTALKLVNEAVAAKDDPEKVAEFIRLNKEENARIRGKKNTRTKVTAKTIKRDRQKLKSPQATPEQIAEVLGDPPPTSTQAQVPTPETPVAMPGPEEHAPAERPLEISPSNWAVGTQALSQRNGVKQLIDALQPFAELSNGHDLNAMSDDDLIEVFARDVKRAWTVYTAATGGLQEGEAA